MRAWVRSNVSARAADELSILYGGSVTVENADDLITLPDIDGFLVDGESLKDAFKGIVRACNDVKK